MLDLWEIIGRLLTNDGLRATVFASRFNPPYNPALDGNNQSLHRLKIPVGDLGEPGNDYKTLRDILTPVVSGPISLMALGEVLVSLTDKVGDDTFQKFMNDLAASLAYGFNQVQPTFDPKVQEKGFYSALGALVLDRPLRTDFVGGNDSFGVGDLLNKSSRAALQQVFAAAGDPDVKAMSLCDLCWDPDCNDKVVEFSKHTHPASNV